jgi:hypothetical protein
MNCRIKGEIKNDGLPRSHFTISNFSSNAHYNTKDNSLKPAVVKKLLLSFIREIKAKA